MSWRDLDWQELDREGNPVAEPKRQPMDPMLRKAKREEIRRRRSASRLAEVRYEEAVDLINECNRRKDDAASQHLNECGPLRSEINDIDRQQAEAVHKGGEVDLKLEKRRRALLEEIAKLDFTLDEKHDAEDVLINRYDAERRALATSADTSDIEADLMRYGDPELINRWRMAKRGLLYGVSVEEAYQAIIDE